MSKDVTLRADLEMTGRPAGVVKGGKFRQLRRNVDLVVDLNDPISSLSISPI